MSSSHTRILLPFVLAFAAVSLAAQDSKPAKPAAPKKGEAESAAPAQDDAVTAKDKAIVAIDKFIAKQAVDRKRDGWRTSLTAPEQQAFDPQREYQWHLQTTKGELGIRLRTDVAPMHVTSTIYLTRLGFYDGLTFHRVITAFMAQGGCPLGIGSGNPGYMMSGEFDPKVKHDKPGLLSMANQAGNPKSDGSQFFLTFVPTPHLDGKHTIFGEVTSGMDVLKALEACGSQSGKTSEKLSIERAWITVVEKGGSDKKGATDKGDDKKGDSDKKGGADKGGADKPGNKGS